MLRMCVLTVFRETDSSLAISTLARLVGRYRSTLSSPGLSPPLTAVATDAAAVLVMQTVDVHHGIGAHD
jgi:hypothetical protein